MGYPSGSSQGSPLFEFRGRSCSTGSSIFDLSCEAEQLDHAIRDNNTKAVSKLLSVHLNKFRRTAASASTSQPAPTVLPTATAATAPETEFEPLIRQRSVSGQSSQLRADCAAARKSGSRGMHLPSAACVTPERRESSATEHSETPCPPIFRNALHVAIQHNAVDVLLLLLANGVDPDAPGSTCDTDGRRHSSISDILSPKDKRDVRFYLGTRRSGGGPDGSRGSACGSTSSLTTSTSSPTTGTGVPPPSTSATRERATTVSLGTGAQPLAASTSLVSVSVTSASPEPTSDSCPADDGQNGLKGKFLAALQVLRPGCKPQTGDTSSLRPVASGPSLTTSVPNITIHVDCPPSPPLDDTETECDTVATQKQPQQQQQPPSQRVPDKPIKASASLPPAALGRVGGGCEECGHKNRGTAAAAAAAAASSTSVSAQPDFTSLFTAEVLQNLPPLFLAVAERNSACVRLLLTYGANVNVRDPHGYTPLHLCASVDFQSVACALVLIEHGGRVQQRATGGLSPFDLAPDLAQEQQSLLSATVDSVAAVLQRTDTHKSERHKKHQKGTKNKIFKKSKGHSGTGAPGGQHGAGQTSHAGSVILGERESSRWDNSRSSSIASGRSLFSGSWSCRWSFSPPVSSIGECLDMERSVERSDVIMEKVSTHFMFCVFCFSRLCTCRRHARKQR